MIIVFWIVLFAIFFLAITLIFNLLAAIIECIAENIALVSFFSAVAWGLCGVLMVIASGEIFHILLGIASFILLLGLGYLFGGGILISIFGAIGSLLWVILELVIEGIFVFSEGTGAKFESMLMNIDSKLEKSVNGRIK